jgi:hypothetical protein
MSDREADDRTLRDYVLGTLPDEERARLELDALRDDGRFEELLAVEDDLLHQYAQDGLPDGERRLLEAGLLASPEGRQRLERARALLSRLEAGRQRARPVTPRSVRWLAAAAALLIAAGSAWLGWRTSRERVREAGVPIPTPAASPTTASPTEAPVRVIALALAPGLVRGGGGPQRARLPAGEALLDLTLTLPRGARGPFTATVSSAEGAQVWSGAAEPSADGTAAVQIPGAALPEGDYELVLAADGGREIASYTFGVLRD